MKILLTLLMVCLCVFPLKEASANDAISTAFYMQEAKTMGALGSNPNTTSEQELIVKNRKQAAAMVKAKYKAKVLSVTTSRVNGNPGYRAKLLGNNGTVFYVDIDAKTGQMNKA